jgi:hypothetical protein
MSFTAQVDVTIRGVTRTEELDVTYLGQWETPWWEGDVDRGTMRRVGFAATTTINRHDYAVSWQDKLPGGGVVGSNKVAVHLDVEAINLDDLERTGDISYYRGAARSRRASPRCEMMSNQPILVTDERIGRDTGGAVIVPGGSA